METVGKGEKCLIIKRKNVTTGWINTTEYALFECDGERQQIDLESWGYYRDILAKNKLPDSKKTYICGKFAEPGDLFNKYVTDPEETELKISYTLPVEPDSE